MLSLGRYLKSRTGCIKDPSPLIKNASLDFFSDLLRSGLI